MRFNETLDADERAKSIRDCLELYGTLIAGQHCDGGMVAVHFPGKIQSEKYASLSAVTCGST